ncbi:GNAT family N-acetyltransferase [Streptomyces sp. NPDC002514]|uniref:GNAT family N-acetyltransferase n=1 Tax=Streptomyces sp. NPDC001270 TaxID=3364554 RepID=UPI0036802505
MARHVRSRASRQHSPSRCAASPSRPSASLDHAQGHGLGGHMMTEFLTWAGPARIRLGVADYNERAVRFYQRHGFEITGERYLWRGRLPTLPMTREAPSAADCS